MNRSLVKFAGGAVVLILAAGCGSPFGIAKTREPYRDAPTDGRSDGSPAKVMEFPDGFSNVAEKCAPHGHVRVFSAYHGDQIRTGLSVVTDASCPE